MTDKDAKLLAKRKGHWYQLAEGELAHTFKCIEELEHVAWAEELVARTKPCVDLMNWFSENQDKIDQPEWLTNWARMEELRTSLFEVRYAFDIHKRGLTPVYEKETVGKSSVDFEVSFPEGTFFVELVSTLQTESMTKQTEHLSEISRLVKTDPADELRKVQSKIVRKVAHKVNGSEEYIPHKFPVPQEGTACYNVIIADTRGFTGGDQLKQYERVQLVWGALHYLRLGGNEMNVYSVGNIPLAGLFDAEKPGIEAQLFRERIHLLGLVSEETFGEDRVIQQIRLYENPYLPDSNAASAAFPLAGERL